MDQYDETLEKFKDVDSRRENVDLDDFEEFMRKVEEVNKMVHALSSNNKSEIEEASQNAAAWLKNQNKPKRNGKEMLEEVINEPNTTSKTRKRVDKTVINEKAFKDTSGEKKKGLENCETMSQEEFMKSVEEDARQRTEDRKQRKAESDILKNEAKKAFLSGDYEKALDLYNKAIDIRKDSALLYTNRALILLKLGLNSRAISDCELAIRLDEENFKAFVYKGKALFKMGEEEKSEEWMEEAKKTFPDKVEEIEEYKKSWSCSESSDS